MTRKPTKPDNPAEYKRFLEAAKKVEADESPEAFDRAFGRVVSKTKPSDRRSRPSAKRDET